VKRERRRESGIGDDSGAISERIRRVYHLLSGVYPKAASRLLEPSRGNPLDVLVAAILSQATNDTLSARAFRRLKEDFPSWEDVVSGDPFRVEEALSCGGLQKEKAKKIRDALSAIRSDFGEITLAPLFNETPETAYEYLLSLPGVGPKTAGCVLAFGLGKPAFPVDTHILRIARRLGIASMKEPAGKVQERLERLVPPEIKVPLHVTLIEHGRKTCHPRKPECQKCPLESECPFRSRTYCSHEEGASTKP